MGVREVTTDSFDEAVAAAQAPVVLDFWGPQCGPCLALMPLVERLAGEYAGKVEVFKVDASQNRRLCIKLRVMGLPTYLLFRKGKEEARISGTVTPEQLQEFVAQAAA